MKRTAGQAGGWAEIEAEARFAFRGEGNFKLPAYSEFMPSCHVGVKPYTPDRKARAATAGMSDDSSFDISEYEQAEELKPGLARIADHLIFELGKLMRGEPHSLSRTLLEGNAAWPKSLADTAHAGLLRDDPLALVIPLALSRTQDDKGNNRWTLFGVSHDGPSAAFWRSLENADPSRLIQLAQRLSNLDSFDSQKVRVLAPEAEIPLALRSLLLADHPINDVQTLITFNPFSRLSPEIQQAYLSRRLTLLPSPAALIFAEHPLYLKLAAELPHARQIPLLHLFPRLTHGCAIRIPQSGWLDEVESGHRAHGHCVESKVARTHRWQRVARDEPQAAESEFLDKVTVALFSTRADDLGLYGKPMARNAQVWTTDYKLLLDGPHSTREQRDHAQQVTEKHGRFGYRFYYPPMRAGSRELYWHFPLIARRDALTGHSTLLGEEPGETPRARAPICDHVLAGYLTAETRGAESQRLVLAPNLLSRTGHHEAATLYAHDPGHRRFTTAYNAHKLLEFSDYLGAPLEPSLARSLLRIAKESTLEHWLSQLPSLASDKKGGDILAKRLTECVGFSNQPTAPLTFEATRGRDFEEKIWRSIASLAEGEFRNKENADVIELNRGRTGGPAAALAHIASAERRELEQLGDHLHARYRELIKNAGMEGKAEVVDHAFQWETEFDYRWSEGWQQNQSGAVHERNIVCMIPGKNRGEAVIMGDHYDTAYMEDVYEAARGGDSLRAAARGADDNHSASTALLMAAEVLLPLSKAGNLERDVWLIHLTGEEFPADCLGARALVRSMVEGNLKFKAESGEARDVSSVRIKAAYVLDMIAHNNDKVRDVFQIAPGEGAASAHLAARAHEANRRWNKAATEWNAKPDRARLHRAARMPDGSAPPPPFKHLQLSGEIRTEWEPKSSLYNTDGQILSDAGVPVVLFMENYDINRTGYHDTHDTMKNIDLDYAAALTAIAIETVAETACAPELP